MVSIGEFARLGGVSVRMLRYYDDLGLLTPHAVDPVTGYRVYRVEQLPRLRRITALSSLGFTLRQVRAVIDDEVAPADLHRLLDLRRTELTGEIAAARARLGSVEARLRAIEAGAVSTHDPATPPFVLREVEPIRLAELTAQAGAASDAHTPEIGDLFAEVAERLAEGGVDAGGTRVVHHHPLGGGQLRVHAGISVPEDVTLPEGVQDTRLAAIPVAACLVVAGGVDEADADMRTLAWWLHDNGYQYRYDLPARQVHLDHSADEPTGTVVELQMGVAQVA